MISVLLVDDQALVRSGFRVILDSQPDIEVVGEATNGEEAILLADELQPDVICMDIEMPVMNGIEAARRILGGADRPAHTDGHETAIIPETTVNHETAINRATNVGPANANSRPTVLVLTTFGHDEYLFDALAAGVSGFLLKTARAEQLVDAVRTLAGGGALLGADVTRAVMQRATSTRQRNSSEPDSSEATANSNSAARRSESDMDLAGLTEREREVLKLVASGLSNAEIAARLFLGEATVKTHVSNLLQKVGVRDRVQLVVWAHAPD